ncbi:MAG: tRNA pseudouridine(55) synthase TruB [Chitinophagales bacterium]|nr:tRNA pseudouridine(55) synthase TruB [Chitinophagaceae bacterium]MCB9065279.1 tRNA pseudouridine(55) synthase TruB [Chitinophagales bacterium]
MKHLPLPTELKEGGVILVDKPYEWTSFDVINKIRKQLHVKIGHCGTLDPLATGLLICCTGKFTKKITDYQKLPKEYTGIFHMGATTPTYDLESEPVPQSDYQHLTEEAIIAATSKFTGDIQQVPPAHSAIKKGGKRAYEYARAGKEIVLEPRNVQITEFEITKIALPEIHFRVACSTGTYIRSLAHDFGQELGCGAYLQELRRTLIGEFNSENALSPTEWIAYWIANG